MLPDSLTLCSDPGLPFPISLGLAAFLHLLRKLRPPAAFVQRFLRYYQPVRLPTIVHHGCTFLLTTRTLATGQGQQRDLPGSAQEAWIRAWGLRPRGVRTSLAKAMCPVLPSELSHAVGTPENMFSRLNTQPIPAPVNACHKSLRTNSHNSGASVVCYSFTARDSHPLLPASLTRRFGTQYLIIKTF